MIYLEKFNLLSDYQEDLVLRKEARRIFNSTYPLHLFPIKDLKEINFSEITIFYGGNGSGKTTLLNIISEKLEAKRKNIINKGIYFDMYVEATKEVLKRKEADEIKIISSDDIFDSLINIRSINAKVNRNKDVLAKVYLEHKFSSGEENTPIDMYEEVKKDTEAKTKTMSRYIRENLGNNNIVEMSNGESALLFWEREITENGIYFLDEPENSLSAENQLKLKKFIEESVRFYNCQFIISTHSPFLLSLDNSLIYDLDENPVKTKKWSELKNVKIYYDFFKSKESDFE